MTTNLLQDLLELNQAMASKSNDDEKSEDSTDDPQLMGLLKQRDAINKRIDMRKKQIAQLRGSSV